MKNYWIITERGSNIDSFFNTEFVFSKSFIHNYADKIHIHLDAKRIFTWRSGEIVDNYDIYIKDFDINKYNQLMLLTSLGMPIEEVFKEIE